MHGLNLNSGEVNSRIGSSAMFGQRGFFKAGDFMQISLDNGFNRYYKVIIVLFLLTD